MVLAIMKPVAITMILVIWAVRVITVPTDRNFRFAIVRLKPKIIA